MFSDLPAIFARNVTEDGLQVEQGKMQRFSLIAVSIGVATTSRRKFSHYGEAVDVATEMKQYAKRQSGSSFAVDRRSI